MCLFIEVCYAYNCDFYWGVYFYISIVLWHIYGRDINMEFLIELYLT